MSDYDIEQAAELAAQAWIRSRNISWLAGVSGGADKVYCGLENRDTQEMEGEESSIIRLPCVICICQGADPVLPNFHGNWNATLRLEIYGSCDDLTGKDFAAMVRQITRQFLTTSIANDLSAATQTFYVPKVAPGNRGWTVDGRRWVAHQEYSLISACSITTD